MTTREDDATASAPEAARRLVVNPTSGTGDHVERVREMAAERGFEVRLTQGPGHASELAEEAVADGAELVAACGGDGTLHEVVAGVAAADALDDVTVGIVPVGTENFFAGLVGVDGVESGFEVLDAGEVRDLDVGFADGEPFVLSAIAGLPADASAAATSDMKARLGPLSFVVTAVQEAAAFDGVEVEVDAFEHGEETDWTGEAEALLVGNLRQFAGEGGQANAEDGLLDVTIVERMPATDLVEEAVEQRLLGRDETDHVTHLRASQLDVSTLDGDPLTFSLDGEIRELDAASMYARPRTLSVPVGDRYDPDPAPES
jgi:YegS/Rv2252/BmrU family lipid kinase